MDSGPTQRTTSDLVAMNRPSILYRLLRRSADRLRGFYFEVKNPELHSGFLVPSHLTRREKVKLFQLSMGASVVAEVGSYLGASACCFGAAMAKSGGGQLICIDTWKNEGMREGPRDTWAEFRNNTRKYNHFTITIRGVSAEVAGQVAERVEKLDVLFLDGDHSYEGVKADWNSYCKLLDAGSVVIFHDYGWAKGVRKVVHEDVMPCVWQYSSLPNMWWGTLAERP